MAILAVFSAMALQATEGSFLYWMIDPDAKIVGNGGVETSVAAGSYYARVGYAATGTTAEQLLSSGGIADDHYLNLYATVDGSLVSINDGGIDNVDIKHDNIRTFDKNGVLGVQSAPVYAVLPMNANNYTYWIELLNADNNNSVAGYGSLGMYEQLADYVSSMQGMATPSMAISVGAFAAPEPSSGLLLLLGVAGLALRRRKLIAA